MITPIKRITLGEDAPLNAHALPSMSPLTHRRIVHVPFCPFEIARTFGSSLPMETYRVLAREFDCFLFCLCRVLGIGELIPPIDEKNAIIAWCGAISSIIIAIF